METNPEVLQERARQLQERISPEIEQARQSLGALNERVTTFIRQRPGTSLLGAVAVGFLVGKIASRR